MRCEVYRGDGGGMLMCGFRLARGVVFTRDSSCVGCGFNERDSSCEGVGLREGFVLRGVWL